MDAFAEKSTRCPTGSARRRSQYTSGTLVYKRDHRCTVRCRRADALPVGMEHCWRCSLRTGAFNRAFGRAACNFPESQADHLDRVVSISDRGGHLQHNRTFVSRLSHEHRSRLTPHRLRLWAAAILAMGAKAANRTSWRKSPHAMMTFLSCDRPSDVFRFLPLP